MCKGEVKNKIDFLWLKFCAKQVDVIEQMIFNDKRIMETSPSGIGKFVDASSLQEIVKKPRVRRKKGM